MSPTTRINSASILPIRAIFDVHFEASGNERAVRSGLEVLKPRGILVQLGLGGDVSIPQNMVVAKEIEMRGTFRFHEEFGLAVDLINQRRVDLTPLLTGVFGLDEAMHAFEVAGDRSPVREGSAEFLKLHAILHARLDRQIPLNQRVLIWEGIR